MIKARLPLQQHRTAFNPLKNWYDSDVVAIGTGITLLVAENARTGHATQRRADHCDPEARRGRIGDGGLMRTTRHHGADLLPLEGEVRRDGEWRREEDEAASRHSQCSSVFEH
jgi:hypothetical protein